MPITVREVGDEVILVAGAHRLEAFKRLGEKLIPAIIVDADDVEAKL